MNREMAVTVSQTIDGWMTKSELEWLFDTASSLSCGATWVEAGTWKGRSYFTIAMALPANSRLVAVDSFTKIATALAFVPTSTWVWDHFQAVFQAVQKLREDLFLSVCRSDTAAASQIFAENSVDAVFLDGDHSREGLLRDIDAWLPKLKPGGILCGHDYNPGFPGVVQAVDERFQNRAIAADTSIWIVRR